MSYVREIKLRDTCDPNFILTQMLGIAGVKDIPVEKRVEIERINSSL